MAGYHPTRGVETRDLIVSRYNLSEDEDEIQNYENSEFEGTQNGVEIDCDESTESEDHEVVSKEIPFGNTTGWNSSQNGE
ncbi:hypothetical protein FQR65_LT13356 [Abscondita terminalis]|nr:hypothetical protein FQR65_LT13356 [Abscondita terminalis]